MVTSYKWYRPVAVNVVDEPVQILTAEPALTVGSGVNCYRYTCCIGTTSLYWYLLPYK